MIKPEINKFIFKNTKILRLDDDTVCELGTTN